jgi:D-ribose pyranose/furanose isomerase RbsD
MIGGETIGVITGTPETDAIIEEITTATTIEEMTITEEVTTKTDRGMITETKENLRDITTTSVELNTLEMAMKTLNSSHSTTTLVKARSSTATREVETLNRSFPSLLLSALR